MEDLPERVISSAPVSSHLNSTQYSLTQSYKHREDYSDYEGLEKPHPEYLSRPGIESDPIALEVRTLPQNHNSGLLKINDAPKYEIIRFKFW